MGEKRKLEIEHVVCMMASVREHKNRVRGRTNLKINRLRKIELFHMFQHIKANVLQPSQGSEPQIRQPSDASQDCQNHYDTMVLHVSSLIPVAPTD